MKHLCQVRLLVLLFVLISCPQAETAPPDLAETLESHVRFLASDSLEGRLPGTPGIDKAAAYIAEEFEAIGLEPAFGESYFQEFEIQLGIEVTEGPYLRFSDSPPVPAGDITVVPISGSGGIDLERLSRKRIPWAADGYSGAIVFDSVPDEVEEERWTMMGRDGVLEYMRTEASRFEEQGARGVVFVTDSEESGSGVHSFPIRRSYMQVGIPVVETTRDALLSAGMAGKGAWPCSLSVTVKPRTIRVKNVGAIRRGTTRANECVVMGAHYDHLGYGDIASSTPWRREVHNGADDNASGVAALIETARWIVNAGPQERSVVCIAFTAEELGALGSEYYCKHPPFPIENTIAMINLDTIGRMEEMKLIVFGALSAEEMSEVLRSEVRYGLEIIEKKEIYGFSDQNPFYARGIPAPFLHRRI